MRKLKLSEWKAEIIVFSLIILVIIVLSFFVSIPITTMKKSELPILGKAPEIIGTQKWINSEPLSIEKLKGSVVLIDFWTYSCINCIRTLPYLNSWHDKYSDKGLIIIGVHTPEFEFEKDYDNVKRAVERYGLKYAVVQDNDYKTWRAFKNSYWPRKYIIDVDGNIRYDHIGEGGYDETEHAIQELLTDNKSELKINMTEIPISVNFSQIGTPEIYLGYKFARTPLGNEEGFSFGNILDYKNTTISKVNTVYLLGRWENEEDRMIAVENSSVYLIYKAKDVNIVAGGKSRIKILVDSINASGNDAENGVVNIDGQRLYNIISSPDYSVHLLKIDAEPGFELYTFTFG